MSKTVTQKETSGPRLLYKEYYLYDGETEIASYDHLKTIKTLKVGCGDVYPPVALEIKQKVYVPICDIFGNIVSLIDSYWTHLAESYRYTAYGEESLFSYFHFALTYSQIGNPWRFKSARVDEESGLAFIGTRYYDPKIASFLSQDFLDKSPQGMLTDLRSVKSPLFQQLDESFFLSDFRPGLDLTLSMMASRRESMRATGMLPSYDDSKFTPSWLAKALTLDNKVRVIDLPGKQHPGVFFSYNNGCLTNFDEAYKAAKMISECLGGYRLTLIHDPTEGLNDFVHTLANHFGLKSDAISATKDLFLRELNKGSTLVPFGFSKGGHTLIKALQDSRFDPYRNKIYPKTFGSPKPATVKEGNNPVNIASTRDIVPLTLFSWDYWFYQDKVEAKTALPIDHSFNSPTYKEALIHECKNIIRQFGLE